MAKALGKLGDASLGQKIGNMLTLRDEDPILDPIELEQHTEEIDPIALGKGKAAGSEPSNEHVHHSAARSWLRHNEQAVIDGKDVVGLPTARIVPMQHTGIDWVDDKPLGEKHLQHQEIEVEPCFLHTIQQEVKVDNEGTTRVQIRSVVRKELDHDRRNGWGQLQIAILHFRGSSGMG